MDKKAKFVKLNVHIGWEQVADIQSADAEAGEKTSKKSLAHGLIENAQNQTGIQLTTDELKELYTEVYNTYCK